MGDPAHQVGMHAARDEVVRQAPDLEELLVEGDDAAADVRDQDAVGGRLERRFRGRERLRELAQARLERLVGAQQVVFGAALREQDRLRVGRGLVGGGQGSRIRDDRCRRAFKHGSRIA